MSSRTNPIPAWSANINYNGPKEERELLGRLARKLGARSVSQLLKHLIEVGVAAKCQASAAELREIRRRYYGATLLLVFVVGLAANWLGKEDLSRPCRRCTRRPGQFEEAITVETEEVV